MRGVSISKQLQAQEGGYLTWILVVVVPIVQCRSQSMLRMVIGVIRKGVPSLVPIDTAATPQTEREGSRPAPSVEHVNLRMMEAGSQSSSVHQNHRADAGLPTKPQPTSFRPPTAGLSECLTFLAVWILGVPITVMGMVCAVLSGLWSLGVALAKLIRNTCFGPPQSVAGMPEGA